MGVGRDVSAPFSVARANNPLHFNLQVFYMYTEGRQWPEPVRS